MHCFLCFRFRVQRYCFFSTYARKVAIKCSFFTFCRPVCPLRPSVRAVGTLPRWPTLRPSVGLSVPRVGCVPCGSARALSGVPTWYSRKNKNASRANAYKLHMHTYGGKCTFWPFLGYFEQKSTHKWGKYGN